MELLCTTASVKSRIHFACNLRTAMSQLLLVFLPLDCGACLFKAPPVCLFTQVINDYHEIENIDNINVCYRLHPLLIYLYYLYYIRQVTGMLSLQTHRILRNSRRLKILFRFIFAWRPHSVLEEFKTKSPETGISATTNLAEGCKKPCLCRVVVKHNEQFA